MGVEPQTYEFDGSMVTARQLHEKMPAYSIAWLRDAMRDGCTSAESIRARHAKGVAMRVAGGNKGARNTLWRNGPSCSPSRAAVEGKINSA